MSTQAQFQHTPVSKAQCVHPRATKTLGCGDGLAFGGTGWHRNGWVGMDPHAHRNSQLVDAPSSVWIFEASGGFSGPMLTWHWVMQWALVASGAQPRKAACVQVWPPSRGLQTSLCFISFLCKVTAVAMAVAMLGMVA